MEREIKHRLKSPYYKNPPFDSFSLSTFNRNTLAVEPVVHVFEAIPRNKLKLDLMLG
jgi:hypothetical protein